MKLILPLEQFHKYIKIKDKLSTCKLISKWIFPMNSAKWNMAAQLSFCIKVFRNIRDPIKLIAQIHYPYRNSSYLFDKFTSCNSTSLCGQGRIKAVERLFFLFLKGKRRIFYSRGVKYMRHPIRMRKKRLFTNDIFPRLGRGE